MRRTDIDQWFETVEPSGNLNGSFAHLRLIQLASGGWNGVQDKLIEYLEHAHHDARRFFHEDLGLSLDPFGGDPPNVCYPSSLPAETLLGYFGEAFCGIISEAMELVGSRQWTVPTFLFRFHNTAGEHLHRLIYGEPVPDNITGRTGSDFLALCLDDNRNVQSILTGEAKCHERFNITQARQALTRLGKQAATAVSLGQLKRILGDLPAREWRQTVRSIETILLNRTPLDRTDLFVYLFEDPGVVSYTLPRLTQRIAGETHGLGRPLQIVEVRIPDLRPLVDTIYQSLYAEEEVPGATN